MKKLFVLFVLATSLFAQGVDYYKNQQKKIAVSASIEIITDTFTLKQIDQVREAWYLLAKYNIKAKLILNNHVQCNYQPCDCPPRTTIKQWTPEKVKKWLADTDYWEEISEQVKKDMKKVYGESR
jgi:hypothetical protein